jgi:hypothetical protein
MLKILKLVYLFYILYQNTLVIFEILENYFTSFTKM